MSTPRRENGAPKPASRAAELAAQQVESIVAAAQTSAQQMADAARREVEAARQEAEQVRVLARESAHEDVERARKEAAARIREAQEAADEVLAEAKAVSTGMRQLANLLTVHAERILRDVANSHRTISADLRAASRDEPSSAATEEPAAGGASPSARPRRPAGGGNPFADLEPPDWVEKA